MTRYLFLLPALLGLLILLGAIDELVGRRRIWLALRRLGWYLAAAWRWARPHCR